MSWVSTKEIGDLCQVSHGSTPSKAEPRYWGGTLAWVSPKDMWVDRISDTEDHLTEDATNEARAPIAEIDSILVVVRSGILVRRLPVAITDRRVSFNQDIKAIFPDKSRLLPEYLWRFLQSREEEVLACGVKKGATVHSVKSGYIEGLLIPLPTDLREQARIVELLDQADALRRQRAEADAKLARLLPALFRHHFGESGRFSPVKLDQLGELDRGRSRHRPRNDPALFDGPSPFIQTGDVTASGGRITSYSQTYSEAGLAQSRLWPKGTLCITIAANIAETAVLDFDACFPDSIVGFTPKHGVSTEFVQAFIDSMRDQLAAGAPQAAQKNINLEVLRNLEVPLPSPAEQDRFARQVTELRSIRTHAAASAAKLETLFQTLLQRAFTGELTAKWREAHLHEGVQEMARLSRM